MLSRFREARRRRRIVKLVARIKHQQAEAQYLREVTRYMDHWTGMHRNLQALLGKVALGKAKLEVLTRQESDQGWRDYVYRTGLVCSPIPDIADGSVSPAETPFSRAVDSQEHQEIGGQSDS